MITGVLIFIAGMAAMWLIEHKLPIAKKDKYKDYRNEHGRFSAKLVKEGGKVGKR